MNEDVDGQCKYGRWRCARSDGEAVPVREYGKRRCGPCLQEAEAIRWAGTATKSGGGRLDAQDPHLGRADRAASGWGNGYGVEGDEPGAAG